MTWILKFIIDEILVKASALLMSWLDKVIYTFKAKKIDDKNIQELEKDKTNGASDAKKITDEINLLNGNDSKS